MLLVGFFSLQGPSSCIGQQKKIKLIFPIFTSDIYRTTDSIHYFQADNNRLMDGTYDIYEIEVLPGRIEIDAVSAPIRTTGNRHSVGSFTKGLKTGVWVYYQGKQRIKEETYRAGRRVSTRKCPCPK